MSSHSFPFKQRHSVDLFLLLLVWCMYEHLLVIHKLSQLGFTDLFLYRFGKFDRVIVPSIPIKLNSHYFQLIDFQRFLVTDSVTSSPSLPSHQLFSRSSFSSVKALFCLVLLDSIHSISSPIWASWHDATVTVQFMLICQTNIHSYRSSSLLGLSGPELRQRLSACPETVFKLKKSFFQLVLGQTILTQEQSVTP